MRVIQEGNIRKVYDPLRDKFVALTPEELVRQQFTSWMRNKFNYPASMMSNEIGIKLNGTQRRCDTVVFGSDGAPLLIVEFKAPNVSITQDTFDQIVRYNMILRAKYLIVSNGMSHFCCVIDYVNNTYHFIPQIPDYRTVTLPFGQN